MIHSISKELIIMEYINYESYNYISNKYHDTSKPFNSFARFIRRDEIFAEETGMDAELIKEKILENDKKNTKLSHPVRKALAFEYVLKNTRISCDNRDIFPAINMIDRPLDQTVIGLWNEEVDKIIPETRAESREHYNAGIATMWPDYDHSIPVWDRVFELGFAGLLKESEKIRNSRTLSEKEDNFFEGIRITYNAIVMFIERLAKLAAKTDGSQKMATALKNIQNNPPKTFYEALLVDYIYFILSEHIEGLQVRSLGNFDRVFYPFYKNDMKNGVSEDEIRTDLAYFLLQFTAIGNYFNQPVFIGGCKEDESTEINELSYIFLDVYDKMNLLNPKIQIKIASSTPKKLALKALDMIRRGNNSIVFVSDSAMRLALQKRGIDKTEARLCDVRGCYDYSPRGAMICGMTYINMLKPLEFALHCGCDGFSGEFYGLKSPALETFDTFEKLYDEFCKQLTFVIDNVIRIVNTYDDYLAYINPQSMMSATFTSCLEKGLDALEGGASDNGSSMNFGALADVADSLAMIKKYVYEKKELTLMEFVTILDHNYKDHEHFRLKILNDDDKYGNNKTLPDDIVTNIVNFTSDYVCGRNNSPKRKGTWNCGYHVARASYDHGEKTAASPNGRFAGDELSKNVSASMGQNRAGATAAIISATKFDSSQFTGSQCLDLGLLPSAVSGDDGLEAMYGLLKTYISRGGHALHINVFDAHTLREAQEHPDKYQDLQIRVSGWNVLWNNINKKEQDGFIKQAEGLI